MPTHDAPVTVQEVTLVVHDLDRLAAFYRDAIGLAELARDGETATLGAGARPLLRLRRDRAAPRWSKREAGLFHTAFLLPSRGDLGAWLAHVAASGHRLSGAGDHGVSEALYLDDPEGNGIEVYWDRPPTTWSREGPFVSMGNERMDLAALAAAAPAPWTGAPEGTVIGHVHLQAGDLAEAEAFWTGPMGFDRTWQYPAARFFSTGGYHHHVAVNVWNSRGAPPLDGPRTGLAELTLAAAPDRLATYAAAFGTAGGEVVARDPFGIPLRIVEAVLDRSPAPVI